MVLKLFVRPGIPYFTSPSLRLHRNEPQPEHTQGQQLVTKFMVGCQKNATLKVAGVCSVRVAMPYFLNTVSCVVTIKLL